jgi:hypothetical protein
MSSIESIDPFSEALEREALRRGREVMKSGKKAPVGALVPEQWERFVRAQHERTILEGRWSSCASSLRRLAVLREEQAGGVPVAVGWVCRQLTERGTADIPHLQLAGLSEEELRACKLGARIARMLRLVEILRQGPADVQSLAARLVAIFTPLAIVNAEWTRVQWNFDVLHGQLKEVRVEWGKAWDELEAAALGHEAVARLHTRLFERSGIVLNRKEIPALVPVVGLLDQVRGLLKWVKTKAAAKPALVKVMAGMAVTTLVVGAVAGARLHHAYTQGAVHIGVNRH